MLKTVNLRSIKYTSINPVFEKKQKSVTECVYGVTWIVQVEPSDEQHRPSLEAGWKSRIPGPTRNLLDQDHDFKKTILIHMQV